MSLQSLPLRKARIPSLCPRQQTRAASLLKRPHRPYTFTQLITLSDGSTYTQRTTSPQPLFKSTKDTRNHPLWQPSMTSLRNKEEDEAGRLRAFRERFGRGWDAEVREGEEEGSPGAQEDSLMDLISGNRSPKQEQMASEGKDSKGSDGEVEMITVKKDGVLVKVPAQSRGERRGGKS